MSELNGEKIEELLWDQGLDFIHNLDDNGVPVIEIYVGGEVVVVGDVWADDNNWCIDTFTLYVTKKQGYSAYDNDYSYPVTDEESLIRKILAVGFDR